MKLPSAPSGELQRYTSWSRLPLPGPRAVLTVAEWSGHDPRPAPCLPFGAGRSYGDTAVLPGGTNISTRANQRILGWDSTAGRVWVEAGASLAQVLALAIPAGWFLPVCPGTAAVTVGGAIAHDVHGKNHPRTGTFGRHVLALELLRSDGERARLTPACGGERWRATLGGLGLTGLILSAELQLVPITSNALLGGRRRIASLASLLSEPADPAAPEFRLYWVDSLRPGKPRVVEYFADYAPGPDCAAQPRLSARWVPRSVQAWCFKRPVMGWFNRLLYLTTPSSNRGLRQHYSTALFPQDQAHPSNHLYGSRGVFAYHALIPAPSAAAAIPAMLARVAARDAGSMVTVLKPFGPAPAPGMLSFTGEGWSFVAGFPNQGQRTRTVLADLDRIVSSAGGKLYPAKDARMPAAMFRSSFPEWERFATHVDPAFDSRFWRRVSGREVAT